MAKDMKLSGTTGRILCSAIGIFLILAGITALILYLVYRPSRPHFTVLSAAVYRLSKATSAAPASALSTTMQFTVAIRNPSGRASVELDRLSAYVSYRDQPVTPASSMPPIYQEKDSTVTVSPVLGGDEVPVSAEVEAALMTDEAYGVAALRLVLMGRVRYRPGPFKSGWVRIFVKCDVLVGLKKGTAGQVPLLGLPQCDVGT